MLKVTREKRASLSEVTCHPWMIHGFSGPADNHLPARQPLDGRKLDRQVIHAMKKFEFGSDQEIERNLIGILETDVYLHALRQWEQRRSPGLDGGNVVNDDNPSDDAVQLTGPFDEVDHGRKTGLFEQCRKKVSSVFSSSSSSSAANAEMYNQVEHQCDPDPPTSTANRNWELQDPTRGFHPLISMYYLTKEKMERSRQASVQDGANDQRTSDGS
jgi:hypothetical protein